MAPAGTIVKHTFLQVEHQEGDSMRSQLTLLACLFFISLTLFGQGGSGTITGTVSDQAGALVPGATVEATNTETGVVFSAVSTNTGNYTISQLPIGTYAVAVKVTG